jgi:hypothetical protein
VERGEYDEALICLNALAGFPKTLLRRLSSIEIHGSNSTASKRMNADESGVNE